MVLGIALGVIIGLVVGVLATSLIQSQIGKGSLGGAVRADISQLRSD